MAQQDRSGGREYAVAGDDVGMAQAGGDDLHQHLIGARRIQFEMFVDEGTTRFADHGGFDFHEYLSCQLVRG